MSTGTQETALPNEAIPGAKCKKANDFPAQQAQNTPAKPALPNEADAGAGCKKTDGLAGPADPARLPASSFHAQKCTTIPKRSLPNEANLGAKCKKKRTACGPGVAGQEPVPRYQCSLRPSRFGPGGVAGPLS